MLFWTGKDVRKSRDGEAELVQSLLAEKNILYTRFGRFHNTSCLSLYLILSLMCIMNLCQTAHCSWSCVGLKTDNGDFFSPSALSKKYTWGIKKPTFKKNNQLYSELKGIYLKSL